MAFWHPFRRRNRDLDDEIRSHFDMAVQERIGRGESPYEAAQGARREFGNERLIKEVTRDMWSWTATERFAQDMKYIFRNLRRSPGFTTIAVLTLALGLGATTAMFSIVNGVLLQPMKYRDPGRLYMAQTVVAPRFRAVGPWPVNSRHFNEWRKNGHSWEQIALVGRLSLTLTGKGEPEQLAGFSISYNFFRTLGVQPALGRDFLPKEELPGDFHVVILADSLWRNRFAADPSIVGEKIVLNGEPHLVVGVMPPGLRLPKGTEWGPVYADLVPPAIFRPLGVDVSQGRAYGNYDYGSIMRLKPGVQPQQAVAEMNALIADLVRQYRIESKPGITLLQDQVTAGIHSSLWLLLGTIGAVLLIVCVNIGNLMLVRTSGRYREAGLRMALGANRKQLFGIVLKEAVVLVAAGGGLGLFLAYAGLKAFVAATPVSLPRLDEVRMDWRVLIIALAAMVLSALICVLAPALRLSRIAPLDSLKAGSANTTEAGRRLRFREAMASVEVALSTVLLIIGGLLMASFFRVLHTDQGFAVARVVTQDFSLISPAYTDTRRRTFIESALLKLRNIPGVESASMINRIPLRGEGGVCGLRDPDQPLDPLHPEAASNFAGLANWRFVAPGYWKTMGIPLKRGRGLDAKDQNRNVAVVSEPAAQQLWPGENPIGKHVLSCDNRSVPLEVVGVFGGTRLTPERESLLMVYQPYWDMSIGAGSFVLRTLSDPARVISALHDTLRSLDSALPILPAQTMQQILNESVAPRRFETYLSMAFAAIALLLASLGIYGIVSFAVARRTPEIGIRAALGARPGQVAGMILREGMRPVFIGLAAGLACALIGGRLLASQLFGVSPHDAETIAAVTILLLLVAVCACLLPARRALRIDPVRALRCE